jgi:hypothetical protein
VWLLDVDGVVNVERPGRWLRLRRGTAQAEGTTWTLSWSPRLVKRLGRLHDRGAVELRWCTTWCPRAHELVRLFGLPRLDRALTDAQFASSLIYGPGQVKAAAALAVVEQERRPLIWTDDAEIPRSGPVRERLDRAPVPSHVVIPDHRLGLQPADLQAIEAFIASLDRVGRSPR